MSPIREGTGLSSGFAGREDRKKMDVRSNPKPRSTGILAGKSSSPRQTCRQDAGAPRNRFTRAVLRIGVALFSVLALIAQISAAGLAPTEPVRFSRDILPILSDNCFACHGPDEQARKAQLRLDTREGAFGKGKSGKFALVANDSRHSEILRRLTTNDPDDVMPPPKSKRHVTPVQIELIRRWIEQGAPWSRHWAFEPPIRPVMPTGFEDVRNPIDAWVQARLAKEGLRPSPEASRTTLIRRVTLDLTGLPPTPEEVSGFLKDLAPGAYDRLVDRLLASSRYGERMAWDWLEAARYADSNGYQGDSERTMWPWRDWIVDAFNRNLPFDQFTVW